MEQYDKSVNLTKDGFPIITQSLKDKIYMGLKKPKEFYHWSKEKQSGYLFLRDKILKII
jgi:hypothetical protein